MDFYVTHGDTKKHIILRKCKTHLFGAGVVNDLICQDCICFSSSSLLEIVYSGTKVIIVILN